MGTANNWQPTGYGSVKVTNANWFTNSIMNLQIQLHIQNGIYKVIHWHNDYTIKIMQISIYRELEKETTLNLHMGMAYSKRTQEWGSVHITVTFISTKQGKKRCMKYMWGKRNYIFGLADDWIINMWKYKQITIVTCLGEVGTENKWRRNRVRMKSFWCMNHVHPTQKIR